MTRHVFVHAHEIYMYLYMYVYVYMYMLVFIFLKKNTFWNTYLPRCLLFQALDLPQWLKVPFLVTKCGRDRPRPSIA